MLNAIVAFSLRHRGVVMALALVMLVMGGRSAYHAELDVFPDFVPPQVVVQTEAPGLSPEQVEIMVTRNIESFVIGMGDLESLRSETIQGLSVITCTFKEGTNLLVARQSLAEKLAELDDTLPAGVKIPKMTPLTSATMDLLKIGLVGEKMTPMQLRTWADWTMKPRLLSVPGVAKCSSFGGEVRQWQIQVRPDRLAAFGLSITDVFSAAKQATGVSGAGFVENANQRILIQPEGQATTAADLEQAIVSSGSDGSAIRIGDVARVTEGGEAKFGDCVIMGKPGVLLTMSSQYGANTMDVTHRLEAAIEEMKPALEKAGITLYPRLHRPATFIETAVAHMQESILIGAGLVALVLLIFIGNLRAALISLTAIPLSLLGTILLMEKLKIPFDTMTLGGLAIAIGEVVDDAIIDVENIIRRLRANRVLEQPLPVLKVVLDASLEVRTAVVFATFVVALVFLPVLTLGGVSGKFFSPLALSYILAILVSLLVAVTVTPAMCLLVFRHRVPDHREPLIQRWLKAGYKGLLRPLARHPGLVGIGAALVMSLSLIVLPRPTGEFLPEFREGHLVVGLNSAPGTSIIEMKRLGTQVQKALLDIPGIATVEQQIGRAEKGEDAWGPHRSEFHVDFKPGLSGVEEEETADALREVLKAVPGIHWTAESFLADRINESLAGETAPVVLSLYGDDLDMLDAKAREAVALLQGIPGAGEVKVSAPPGGPKLEVRLRQDRLASYGFRAGEVLDAVETAYQGATAAHIFEPNQVSDVVVILEESARQDPETVGKLPLTSSSGRRATLAELADISLTTGRYSILRDGARRRQTIACNPQTNPSVFVAEAKKRLAANLSLPAGSYWGFEGTAEAEAEATRQLILHSAVGVLGIVMLLGMVFRNGPNLTLVLSNLPFALVGGVFSVACAGLGLTLGSLVGFVTLFGITTRNSIMLMSHYDHLVRQEGCTWGLDTALRGAAERLTPILMTALVTSLGLLPLALGYRDAGREIEGPMAIVILGGLASSTLLNLLVLPVMALKFGRFGEVEE